jgi:hypothetical protein
MSPNETGELVAFFSIDLPFLLKYIGNSQNRFFTDAKAQQCSTS